MPAAFPTKLDQTLNLHVNSIVFVEARISGVKVGFKATNLGAAPCSRMDQSLMSNMT